MSIVERLMDFQRSLPWWGCLLEINYLPMLLAVFVGWPLLGLIWETVGLVERIAKRIAKRARVSKKTR